MSCLRIALTGGIGSGKSTVLSLFTKLGAPTHSADDIARQQVAPGTPALATIQQRFGPEIVTQQGQLNRRTLRDIIMHDNAEKQWLEALLHPQIYAVIQQYTQTCQAPYCVIEIPLLFETAHETAFDRVLVVDSPEVLQIKRCQQRDGATAAATKAIIKQQTRREQRLAAADDIIDNSDTPDYLARQVAALHQCYSDVYSRGDPGH